ncbi:MAG: D-alanyl-D-alanine carboxypeptidase, partial [Actinomycetota bacterium]
MRKGLLALLTASTLVTGTLPSHALHSLEKYISAKSLASPGLLIINPNDGKVIAQNSPESLRVPASILKLISTSAALHFVGPDKTYSTTIYSTDQSSTFVIKGTLDPWLTSNLTLSKKNGQKFLPSLVTQANTENKKKLTIYYTGIFEKDKYDLSANLKSKGIRATFKKIAGDAVSDRAKDEVASLTSLPMSEMVKFAIMWSDNTLANRLGNSAARKIGYETTPAGLTKTFKLALDEIGVDSTGLKVEDGSG